MKKIVTILLFALTVFARFDNILDKHSAQVFNVPTQGFTGLFGIGYKF